MVCVVLLTEFECSTNKENLNCSLNEEFHAEHFRNGDELCYCRILLKAHSCQRYVESRDVLIFLKGKAIYGTEGVTNSQKPNYL